MNDLTGVEFSSYNGDQTIVDTKGNKWHLTESELTSSNGKSFTAYATTVHFSLAGAQRFLKKS